MQKCLLGCKIDLPVKKINTLTTSENDSEIGNHETSKNDTKNIPISASFSKICSETLSQCFTLRLPMFCTVSMGDGGIPT